MKTFIAISVFIIYVIVYRIFYALVRYMVTDWYFYFWLTWLKMCMLEHINRFFLFFLFPGKVGMPISEKHRILLTIKLYFLIILILDIFHPRINAIILTKFCDVLHVRIRNVVINTVYVCLATVKTYRWNLWLKNWLSNPRTTVCHFLNLSG